MLPANYETATETIASINNRQRDLATVLRDHHARYIQRDSSVKAWEHTRYDAAIKEAQGALSPALPLHGMVLGVKDIALTKDMPTEFGSAIYSGAEPLVDASVVELCRMAGATILGKTTTHEFAWGGNPQTINPLAPDRKAGGSSVGSAAAVCDFQCHVALGTQTTGSTVRPASNQGVFGFKPTWGTVCLDGIKSLAPSFDTIGILARSVADIQLLSRELGIIDNQDNTAGLANLRIGLITLDIYESSATSGLRSVWTQAQELLTVHGACLQEVDLGPDFCGWSGLSGRCSTIVDAESGTSLLVEYRKAPDLLSDMSREVVEARASTPKAQLADLYGQLAALRPRFDAIASQYDAILTPSTPGEAPMIGQATDHNYASLWTGLHVPMINVPGLCNEDGLPIGLSLVGPRFSDEKVLSVAMAVGEVFDHAHRDKRITVPTPASPGSFADDAHVDSRAGLKQ